MVFCSPSQSDAVFLLFLNSIYLFIFGCAGFSLLCNSFSLVAASRDYSLVVALGLLITVASLVAEHRLEGSRASAVAAPGLWLSSCGAWA